MFTELWRALLHSVLTSGSCSREFHQSEDIASSGGDASTCLLQNTVHLLILSSTAAYLLVGLYSVTYRFVPASLVRGTVRHLLAWSRGKFLSRRPPVPPSWESKIIRILMRSHRQPNSSVWKPVSVPLCVFTSVWEAFQFEHNGSKSVIVRFL